MAETPDSRPARDEGRAGEGSQILKDREFFAAQRRLRDAKRELKSAEDALWALLGEKHV